MISNSFTASNDVEQQQAEINVDTTRKERAQWIMNSLEPPSPWLEIMGWFKTFISLQPSKKIRTKRITFLLQGLFPILTWGKNYKLSMFKHDLMAGLTLASLSIPQSIGYANLAKLDPQYGLYTSVVPPVVYALMGSSREIAIGPVAVVSMLLSSSVDKIVDPSLDPVAYRKLIFTVTLFAGLFQAMFGFFRLGFLVELLSHAAIVGFMGGAAIIIGLQQLRGLLGITHFTTKTDIVSVLTCVFRSVSHSRWCPLNFVFGCSFLILLLAARFIGKRNKKLFWIPAIAPLISVILSTLIVFLTKAEKHGVMIVKHLKGGFNPSSVNQLQFNGPHVGYAAKTGLISALVALAEAIAVGRSFASLKGYQINGNNEMVAMGFMNIVGSLTSCYVATGSFSRTAVNFSAGCESVVSNIVMAVSVMLCLQLFTKLLYYTPIAILASIILSALPGLIDINEAHNIWTVDKLDFLVCIAAFLGVLFASVEIGLLTAVIISFGKILLNLIRPSIEALGRIPRTDIFCGVSQYPMAIEASGILIMRVNCSLICFANASFIRERMLGRVSKDDPTRAVILDMSNVVNIDTSGIIALEELHREFTAQGIQLAVGSPSKQVIQKLRLAKFVERIGVGWIFLSVGDAVDACLAIN